MSLLGLLLRVLQAAIWVLAEIHSYLEAGLGKKLFPNIFRFLAECVSFQLYDPGPCLFVGFYLETTLRS